MSLSPSELLKIYLESDGDLAALAPGGVIVAGATRTEMTAGCVILADTAPMRNELYAPIRWPRTSVRCVATSFEKADRIGQHVFDLCDQKNSITVEQMSTGDSYFIHTMSVNGGPSMSKGEDDTVNESVMFVVWCVGTDVI